MSATTFYWATLNRNLKVAATIIHIYFVSTLVTFVTGTLAPVASVIRI